MSTSRSVLSLVSAARLPVPGTSAHPCPGYVSDEDVVVDAPVAVFEQVSPRDEMLEPARVLQPVVGEAMLMSPSQKLVDALGRVDVTALRTMLDALPGNDLALAEVVVVKTNHAISAS